jgi:hypothetical protein
MHQMRGGYVTRELLIRSVGLLEEMLVVVQDGDSIGAPESRNENCKDDRVFATALANRAWINWVRPSMIAQGQTYEREMARQAGEVTPKSERINSQVFRFFKTMEERENMEPERGPRFLVDRGLI